MWLRKIFLIFLLSVPLHVFTQAFSPPLRIEIDVPSSEFPFHVIPLAHHGVAILYETEVVENKKVKWSIVLFDTNLQKKATTDLWLEKNLTVEVVYNNTNDFYLCLQKQKYRSTLYNTYFVHYTLPDRKAKVYAINTRDKEEVIDLYVAENKAYYVTVFNQNEIMYVLDLQTLTSQRIYAEENNWYSYQFFKNDTLNNCLWIASTKYTSKTEHAILLTQINKEGEQVENIELSFDKNYRINHYRMISVDKEKQLIVGTYINENESHKIRYGEVINTGVFSVLIKNGIAEEPQFYNFLLLSSQFDKRRIPSITKKETSLNLQLVLNEITKNDSINVFVGEVFYPEYRQEYAANYGMYGYTSAPTSVFAGYRYQLAYILTFNNAGELIWNSQLQYNSLLVKSIRNVLHAYVDDNNDVLLYYGVGAEIITTILNDRNIIQPTENMPIEMSSPTDRIVTQYTTHLKHWYDTYFIYYGYQTIAGSRGNKKMNLRRNVLFINKLAYR